MTLKHYNRHPTAPVCEQWIINPFSQPLSLPHPSCPSEQTRDTVVLSSQTQFYFSLTYFFGRSKESLGQHFIISIGPICFVLLRKISLANQVSWLGHADQYISISNFFSVWTNRVHSLNTQCRNHDMYVSLFQGEEIIILLCRKISSVQADACCVPFLLRWNIQSFKKSLCTLA